MKSEAFDVIVVGAGSSGCVLAARLSEDPGCRVLLLEAGPDFDSAHALPAALRDASEAVLSGFNWHIPAQVRQQSGRHHLQGLMRTASVLAASPRDSWAAANAVVRAPQPAAVSLHTFPYTPGKVVGGSSSVNGAVALRPWREDFEAWRMAGGEAWSWDQVLPYFRRLEDDRDCGGALHGCGGPIPVARPALEALSAPQDAFRRACLGQGFGWVDDLNASAQPGVGALPSNSHDGVRISAALAYLLPARSRPNLVVRGEHLVHRVRLEGGHATGVEVSDAAGVHFIQGARIFICAGALHTPGVLLRSGIGDADECRALGLPSALHLPGVGCNLADHPAVMLWMVPRGQSVSPAPRKPQHQIMARAASCAGGAVDLSLFFLSGFATAGIPMLAQMLRSPVAHALSVVLARPVSRGRVHLVDANPATAPVVELNLCASATDTERLMAGVRQAWQLARSEPIQAQVQSTFLWNDNIVGNDSLLRAAVDRLVSGTWHAVGTARMGPSSDPTAVVDAQLRVHGTHNLYVVDASVMPEIPSTPTNLCCMMLAERAAAWLIRGVA